MVSEWRMSGSLLGECNCDWGCPCSFAAPPSHGSCRGVYTWIIDKGAYGDVKLDGLGVALPGIWPGAVHLGHGTQLVLIDGRATPAQRKALETLGKGDAGGPFAVFASVTERWLPDRKSTRLNSSHGSISYAVFCLKKNTQAHK